MRRWLLVFMAVALILGTAGIAGATRILYTATDNGGGNYTLDLEVVNDTLGEEIGWFSVFFGDTADGLNFENWDQYTNLDPDDWGTTQAGTWEAYSFEPSAIDLPAQFNADATTTGIGVGASLAGFSVTFDWTGVGSLGDFYFEVGEFDSFGDYVWLDDGYMELADSQPVPEPATILLVATGMLGLGVIRKRKNVH